MGMTERTPELTRHDLEAKIVKRSWEDEGFRSEFIADPAGAFVKYINVPRTSLPRITVHPEEPGSWHIVLPVKPANAGELSEEDLEKVAGGVTPTVIVSVAVSSAVVSAASVSVSATATITLDKGW
jgi:hypothetical protein